MKAISAIHAICTIRSPRPDLPPLSDGVRQLLENFDGVFPANTRVRDADPLLQASRALGRHFLGAFVDIGLDHDADDAGLALP